MDKITRQLRRLFALVWMQGPDGQELRQFRLRCKAVQASKGSATRSLQEQPSSACGPFHKKENQLLAIMGYSQLIVGFFGVQWLLFWATWLSRQSVQLPEIAPNIQKQGYALDPFKEEPTILGAFRPQWHFCQGASAVLPP